MLPVCHCQPCIYDGWMLLGSGGSEPRVTESGQVHALKGNDITLSSAAFGGELAVEMAAADSRHDHHDPRDILQPLSPKIPRSLRR